MMLTIHGLPLKIKYHELKNLIKEQCNMTDFILDNLIGDGMGFKKVRIGVADEAEGAHLSKCLNGFRLGGNALRVMPIAKMVQPQGSFDQHRGPMPRNDGAPISGNFVNQPRDWNGKSASFMEYWSKSKHSVEVKSATSEYHAPK
ncbi:hypothetical protein ACJJTC_011411 [Scirpophaga incertulas]